MEAIHSSETSIHTRSTPPHIPEDGILHSHRRENLKSYKILETSYAYAAGNNSSSLSLADSLFKPWPSLEDSARLSSGFSLFGFRNNNFYRSRSSSLRPSLNLEDQVSVFMSPSDRVAQVYPQALGSLSAAFYDSQGYGGGILTNLHTGLV
jgi:hypothetical protein